MRVDLEDGHAEVVKVKSVTGEVRTELLCGADPALRLASGISSCAPQATLSIRKGNKKMTVYDLTVELTWEGHDAELDERVTGALKIAEFASGHDPEDLQVTVSTEGMPLRPPLRCAEGDNVSLAAGKGKAHDKLKAAVKRSIQERVLDLLTSIVVVQMLEAS